MWSFIKICLICIIGINRLTDYSLPCSCSQNLSSFWLILKQQWTIKISSPLFLFLAWRPSWLEVGITGHNFWREPSKDHSNKVWSKFAQCFLRRRLKCEKITTRWDGLGWNLMTKTQNQLYLVFVVFKFYFQIDRKSH